MNIAIIHHVRISGGAHPANQFMEANGPLHGPHAQSVLTEQFEALQKSELLGNAQEYTLSINGTEHDVEIVRRITQGMGHIRLNKDGSAGELPTMDYIQSREKPPGWAILYLHCKGVSWPPGRVGWQERQAWRRCMMKAVVWRWRECIEALKSGCDMAGAHWLTKEAFPNNAAALPRPIWGGNFWWAKSEYLAQLPDLLSLEQNMHLGWRYRFQAEQWPTSGRMPRVLDLASHWPGLTSCLAGSV